MTLPPMRRVRTTCILPLLAAITGFAACAPRASRPPPATVHDVTDLVGNTPMVLVDGVYAKLEAANPTGSIKDRLALALIRKGRSTGALHPGQEIVELTSGNTGASFALLASVMGYRFTAVMPENFGVEKQKAMRLLGARVEATPAAEGFAGAVRRYEAIQVERPDAWFPRQFDNPENVEENQDGLAQEILAQMDGRVDAFVAGVGTGGTLIGVAKALRRVNPRVRIVAVEPAESPVLSGGKAAPHRIEGIGETFVPPIFAAHRELVDEIVLVKGDDAVRTAMDVGRRSGLYVGISAGANLHAARTLTGRFERVVTVLPDRGGRYLADYIREDAAAH